MEMGRDTKLGRIDLDHSNRLDLIDIFEVSIYG